MVTGNRQTRPRVAIIIPLFNEQDGLRALGIRLSELHRGLKDRFAPYYLFVDDGSTDRTVQFLPRTVPQGAPWQTITHGSNRGLGEVFRTGFAASGTAEIVCTLDAASTYAASDLVPMVDLVANGRADVVVASPYHPQGSVEGVPFWKLALSRRCSALYRMILPVKLYTYTSIFRVYRGSFARRARFRSSGFLASVEILISAARLGYRIHEMPLTLRRGTTGGSKRPLLPTIAQHVRLMLQCAFVPDAGETSERERSQGKPDSRVDAMGTLVSLTQDARVSSARLERSL